jgi:hypothetical protein
MKKIIAILILRAVSQCSAAGTAMAYQDQTPAAEKAPINKKKPAKPAAKNPDAAGLTIPADAKANPDGTFSVTDKSGQKWRYAKTPFGVMRSRDDASPDAAEAPDPGLKFVTAKDNGDTVTFVRQTPFGPIRSEKKKSDLTDAERQLLTDQKAKPE